MSRSNPRRGRQGAFFRVHPRAAAIALATLVIFTAGCGTGDPSFDGPPDADQVALGEEVFRDVCSECHSLEPPPKLAPPMTEVAAEVRASTDDRRRFTEHVVAYVQAPSEEASVMPVGTIREFGLMPAQRISPERARAAAAYLWTLGTSAADDGEGSEE